MGEELTYELTAKADVLAEAEGDAEPLDQEIRVTITPVRENADGSWRLIFKTKVRLLRFDDEGTATPRFENEVLGWCDMSPNGTYADNPTIRDNLLFGTVPEYVFPPLPRDDDSPVSVAMGYTYSLRVVKTDGPRVEVNGEVASPLDPRYDNRRILTVQFDTSTGRPLTLVTDSSGGDPDDRFHNRTTVELTAVRDRSIEEVAAYATEAAQYFKAYEAWFRVATNATQTRTRDECESLFNRGRILLVQAQDQNQAEELAPLYEILITKHDEGAKDELQEASKRESLYQLDPVDWQTTDLNGKTYSRRDFQGRVVLLDYWYRGCPHCIKALPVLKKVQKRFADAPFAILGVNKDHDPADARHVIKAFNITYTTLRNELAQPVESPDHSDANEPSQKGTLSDVYGVRGWPTFVVLDQEGRVAAIQEGYGDNLETSLTETIAHLLNR